MRILSSHARHCLAQLSRVLGAESASVELKWLMRAIDEQRAVGHQQASDTLSAMVARRVSGEPLQYILGE